MRIPPLNIEIEQIYAQLPSNKRYSIAICSAKPDEGVTSIALALAHRNLLAGQTTLLVDLNLYQPSLNTLLALDSTEQQLTCIKTDVFGTPQLVTSGEPPIALIGVTSPARRDLVIKLRKPGVLEQYINEWQKTFDTIIFDTSPTSRINASNIPAQRVAAACDGSLLVVLAGNTTQAMVLDTTEKLKLAGANLLGCIFNDRDNPPLKSELLRESQRLEPHFTGLARYITNWLSKNHLLSTQV